MSRDIIYIGNQPNDGNGQPLRTAFAITNNNFVELWTQVSNVANQGPYANDSVAATANVPLKSLYYSADGIVRIRLT